MSTSPTLYSLGKPALKDWGGSKRTFGKRKRPLAMRLEAQAAANAVQPTGSDHRNNRRLKPEGSAAAFGAGAGAAAGAATGALGTAVGVGGLSWPSVMKSCLVALWSSRRTCGNS